MDFAKSIFDTKNEFLKVYEKIMDGKDVTKQDLEDFLTLLHRDPFGFFKGIPHGLKPKLDIVDLGNSNGRYKEGTIFIHEKYFNQETRDQNPNYGKDIISILIHEYTHFLQQAYENWAKFRDTFKKDKEILDHEHMEFSPEDLIDSIVAFKDCTSKEFWTELYKDSTDQNEVTIKLYSAAYAQYSSLKYEEEARESSIDIMEKLNSKLEDKEKYSDYISGMKDNESKIKSNYENAKLFEIFLKGLNIDAFLDIVERGKGEDVKPLVLMEMMFNCFSYEEFIDFYFKISNSPKIKPTGPTKQVVESLEIKLKNLCKNADFRKLFISKAVEQKVKFSNFQTTEFLEGLVKKDKDLFDLLKEYKNEEKYKEILVLISFSKNKDLDAHLEKILQRKLKEENTNFDNLTEEDLKISVKKYVKSQLKKYYDYASELLMQEVDSILNDDSFSDEEKYDKLSELDSIFIFSPNSIEIEKKKQELKNTANRFDDDT